MDNNSKNNSNSRHADGSDLSSDFNRESPNQENFHLRLKNRREELKMSQKGLAFKVGVSDTTIQGWERDIFPNSKYLELLTKTLMCSSNWLILGEGQKSEIPGTCGYTSEMYKKFGPIDLSPDAETLLPEIEKRAKYRISQDKKDYDFHSGQEPSIGGEEWAAPMGRAYHILTSATIYKGALLSNINAFFMAIQQEELNKKQGSEIDNLKKECDELKLRLSEMEKNLKGVHVILEQKIIDLKMQTDRRTGGDRRENDEPIPPEDERRNGEDRRKALVG